MKAPIQQAWSLLLESANAADLAIQMESSAASAQDLSFVCLELETASTTLSEADNLLRCGGYPTDHALSIVAEKLRRAQGLSFRAAERAILVKEAYEDLANMAEKVWTGAQE